MYCAWHYLLVLGVFLIPNHVCVSKSWSSVFVNHGAQNVNLQKGSEQEQAGVQCHEFELDTDKGHYEKRN